MACCWRPQAGSDESRPIAVGSCILRAWHRAVLAQLPGQRCGRRGSGVLQATADWVAAPGEEGTELDVAKAFHSVVPTVATTALAHFGTLVEVVALLRAAWSGPRCCHVMGELAEPISLLLGLPPGCSASPTTLAVVVAPWPGIVSRCAPGVQSSTLKTHEMPGTYRNSVYDVSEILGLRECRKFDTVPRAL